MAGSYPKDALQLSVDATDPVGGIRPLAGSVAAHPSIAVTVDTASPTMAGVAVGGLAFVRDVAPHRRSIEE